MTELAVGVVEQDAPCRKCGYNLRGLDLRGRCPECGTPVGLAIHGQLLKYSDPAWVGTLARGVRLIIAGLALMVAAILVNMVLSIVVPPTQMLPMLLLPMGLVVMYLLSLIGSWLLTSPDPSGIGEDRYGRSRKIIRFSLLVGLASTVLSLGARFGSLPPQVMTAIQTITILASLVGVVGMFAQLDYFQKLALRIPDQKLAGRASILKYSLGISYAVVVFMQFVILLGAWGGSRRLLDLFAPIAGIAGLVLLFSAIAYLLLLEKLGKRFAEAAKESSVIWGAQGEAIEGKLRVPLVGP
ncbi:MAG TPA: hypothetical protein VF669_05340 [Tepidisphaeraceae bacterium]